MDYKSTFQEAYEKKRANQYYSPVMNFKAKHQPRISLGKEIEKYGSHSAEQYTRKQVLPRADAASILAFTTFEALS